MPRALQGGLAAEPQDRFAVVVSRFNEAVTGRLRDGCLRALRDHGVSDEQIDVAYVPGAFEIPVIAQAMAESRRYAAVVCLGAVIRGETPHFDYVAGETAAGIAAVACRTGVPCIFGVLTTDTVEQALARAGVAAAKKKKGKTAGRGKKPAFSPDPSGGNKGYDSGLAAIEMAGLLRAVRLTGPRAVHGKYDGG